MPVLGLAKKPSCLLSVPIGFFEGQPLPVRGESYFVSDIEFRQGKTVDIFVITQVVPSLLLQIQKDVGGASCLFRTTNVAIRFCLHKHREPLDV